MKHVCPVAMRASFAGFYLPSKHLVQRQNHQVLSLARAAIAVSQSRSSRPVYDVTKAPQPSRIQSCGFSTSSKLFARKRWVKSSEVSDAPNRKTAKDVPRTWQDYDPKVGVPLDSGELDQTTIAQIFGTHVDEATGNHVLRLMNYRRRSGSLIDVGASFPPETGISSQVAIKALDYLRAQNPDFDEQGAGAAWAEAEVNRVEQEYMNRAESLGLYKKSEAESESGSQGTKHRNDPYGESALVNLRKANKARWMEEDRKKKELKDKQEAERLAQLRASGVEPKQETNTTNTNQSSPEVMSLNQPVGKAWLQPVERKAWVKYYEEQATIIKDNKVPQLSLFRRLGPAALVALGVVAGCLVLHEMYAPPPKSARIFPNVPPAVATLGTITAINFAIFIAWRMPVLWRTLNKYFQMSPGYPSAAAVLGAQFSHQTSLHLFSSTLFLWPFGLMCKFCKTTIHAGLANMYQCMKMLVEEPFSQSI